MHDIDKGIWSPKTQLWCVCTLHYVTRSQRTARAHPPQWATITRWDRSHLSSASTCPAPAQKLKGEITKVEELWEAAWTMFSETFPSRNMGRLNHNAPFCSRGMSAVPEDLSSPLADLWLPWGREYLYHGVMPTWFSVCFCLFGWLGFYWRQGLSGFCPSYPA